MKSIRTTILSATTLAALFLGLPAGEAGAQDALTMEFSDASVKELMERAQRGVSMEELGPWIAGNARISAPRGMERARLSVVVVDASGRVLGSDAHRLGVEEEEEVQMIPARELGASLGRLVPGGRMVQPEDGGQDIFISGSRLVSAGTAVSSPEEGVRVAAELGARAIRASGSAGSQAVLLLLTPDEERFRAPVAPTIWALVVTPGAERMRR